MTETIVHKKDDFEALDKLVDRDLRPIVNKIDQDGFYPKEFLKQVGDLGGFKHLVSSSYGGDWSEGGNGLRNTIRTMAHIGDACLSTAFAYWCHTACSRYIQLSFNNDAKAKYLPSLATGRLFGGTGLSNTLKSCCEIERFLLSAKRVAGGYEINGTLPWVSNLGSDHIFVTGCPLQGDTRLVFLVVDCSQDGFKLVEGTHFTALEGTRTFACQFDNVFIEDVNVLAHPEQSAEYIKRIQPGMILAQLGMGFGLIQDCIREIEHAAKTHSHINCYEQEQANFLKSELNNAVSSAESLAIEADLFPIEDAREDLITNIMKARLAGGELSLRAAQGAMLHQGARGYLKDAVAQRRLREAYFVAIVTPALKHLRREIALRDF